MQAQIEAKEEAAKLKRRSRDIERQMQEYIEEKEKFHQEREQERTARLEVNVIFNKLIIYILTVCKIPLID